MYDFYSDRRYKAEELHRILSNYAEKNNIDYSIENIKMLASKLQDNDKFFEKEYNVKIHKSK
jgi:hypothetical protein